jgi:YggT family protein
MTAFLIMIVQILQLLISVLQWIIIAHAIMSWLVQFNVISLHTSEFGRTIWNALQVMTRPIYAPIRRVMPDTGMLDLSPLVALLVLYILNNYVLDTILQQLVLS